MATSPDSGCRNLGKTPKLFHARLYTKTEEVLPREMLQKLTDCELNDEQDLLQIRRFVLAKISVEPPQRCGDTSKSPPETFLNPRGDLHPMCRVGSDRELS